MRILIISTVCWMVCFSIPAASAMSTSSNGNASRDGYPPPPTMPGDPDLLPDLRTQSPFHLVLIEIPSADRRLLRFSNAISNEGFVDLELRGRFDHEEGSYKVSQKLPVEGGAFEFVELDDGYIHYHPEHYHWHLEGFARYEIWSSTPGGKLRELLRSNGKVSYCIMDTDRLEGSLSNSQYHSCGPTLQGLSTGWADTYERHLPGQWVDISGLPDGYYALRSIVDPFNFLHEVDNYNNDVLVTFFLNDGTLKNVQTVSLDWNLTRPQP